MDKIDLDAIMHKVIPHTFSLYGATPTEVINCMKKAIHQTLVLGSSAVVEELTSSTDLNVQQITNAAKAVLNIEKLIV